MHLSYIKGHKKLFNFGYIFQVQLYATEDVIDFQILQQGSTLIYEIVVFVDSKVQLWLLSGGAKEVSDYQNLLGSLSL